MKPDAVMRVATYVGGTLANLVCFHSDTANEKTRYSMAITDGAPPDCEQGNRFDFFNLRYGKPPPLAGIFEDFRREAVEAVAACILHSHTNPEQDCLAKAEQRSCRPDAAAVSSGEAAREWSEYGRTHSAILSAYVQPVAKSFLRQLAASLGEVGNGGGSIASIADFQKLHAEPRSAGVVPALSTCAESGSEATTTVANLCPSRTNRNYFYGGEMEPDMAAAERALAGAGENPGIEIDDAARGFARIVNSYIVDKLKLASMNQGCDPSDFMLAAFGGGGRMHPVALVRVHVFREVVETSNASVFPVRGMIMSDLRRDCIFIGLSDLEPDEASGTEAAILRIEVGARSQFASEGLDAPDLAFARFETFRYENQEHATEINLFVQESTHERIPEIFERFQSACERNYTNRLKAPVELFGTHLADFVAVEKMKVSARSPSGVRESAFSKRGQRTVFADEDIRDAAIDDAALPDLGMMFDCPATVEDSGSTFVMRPCNHAKIDGYGNIALRIES